MTKTKKDRVMLVDPFFDKELMEVKMKRMLEGVDKKLKSDRRLTLALTRSSYWIEIKKEMSRARMDD